MQTCSYVIALDEFMITEELSGESETRNQLRVQVHVEHQEDDDICDRRKQLSVGAVVQVLFEEGLNLLDAKSGLLGVRQEVVTVDGRLHETSSHGGIVTRSRVGFADERCRQSLKLNRRRCRSSPRVDSFVISGMAGFKPYTGTRYEVHRNVAGLVRMRGRSQ